MLLKRKTAVVYGAGSVAGAVARAFAREGARVEIASRSLALAETLAGAIDAGGGAAGAHEVDALDENAVRAFVDGVVAARGSIDISLNLIPVGDDRGTPLIEIEWESFATPIDRALRSTFNTVKAVAPHMARSGGGAVLFVGGPGDPVPDHSIGGFQIALHAVEAMRRQYSEELGDAGVRFVTLRTGGVADTIADVLDGGGKPSAGLNGATVTGRAATLEDIGAVAAFVASDRARTMTAATVNVSAGALID